MEAYRNRTARKYLVIYGIVSVCILFAAGVILHMELLRIKKTENQTVTAVIVQGMMEQETANAKQTDMAAMDVLSEILADPEQYQKAQEAEYQNVQELLRRYGYSSQESLIRAAEPDKRTMVLRLLLLLAGTELIFGVIFGSYLKERSKKLSKLSSYMDQIARGHYDLVLSDNEEDELSHLKNQIYKLALSLREEAENSRAKKCALAESVSDISHQLKTPLTSVSILLDNLNDNEDMPMSMRKKFLAEITRQIYSMNWMIVAMLRLSRLDAGMIEFEHVPYPIVPLVQEAIGRIEVIAELKNISVRIDDPGEVITCIGDPKWMKEAIINLIKNAVEHSPEHAAIGITIKDNSIDTEIAVVNQGKAIPREVLKRIFERYYSASNAPGPNAGIGLPLAKAIIEQQNGYLEVESDRTQTIFTIKLLK